MEKLYTTTTTWTKEEAALDKLQKRTEELNKLIYTETKECGVIMRFINQKRKEGLIARKKNEIYNAALELLDT
jgi:hypothetical protein